MRQYAGFGSAAQTNERFRYLLDAGPDRALVAFDLPTQMGYDSRPSRCRAARSAGWAWPSRASPTWRRCSTGLPLDRVTTSMTINATAPLLLAFYVAVADARGMPRGALGGTVQNDMLKEYIARGTYIYPPAPVAAADHRRVRRSRPREVPQWNSISVSGYHMREAGCTAVAGAGVHAGRRAHLPGRGARRAASTPRRIARRISFFFNAHNHLFEEVGQVPRGAQAVGRPAGRAIRHHAIAEALKLRFHTQTAGSMLTAQQPLNNVVRVAVQGLAAVLGGTQSLHTNSYDEALGLPGPRRGAARAAHPAGAGARERRHRYGRSARRLLLRSSR